MNRVAARGCRRGIVAALFLLLASPLLAQSSGGLDARIDQIIGQPRYRHASFGIEVYSLDDNKVVYAKNAQQLFTPASTTKLVTEGTALELLGPNYRFDTRVYRTGPVDAQGTLHGDLVLVGSGDPNLSGRIRPDGTLTWENVDHCYDGSPETKAVPGDPLLVIHELAHLIAARGIKRIEGRVLVDATLFPEGKRELGTGVVISPISVNDNLIDVTVTPGAKPGDPVSLHVSPESAYARFVNQIVTGPGTALTSVDWGADQTQPDGSHVVAITGAVPAGAPSVLYSYRVPQPSRFAEMTLVQALRQDGVQAQFAPYNQTADFAKLSAGYVGENIVAEHLSPPLSQEIMVTLKVSQNLHASMTPYILGAVLGHARRHILQAGFDLERAFLARAGLELGGASQSDGAGGSEAAFFTPDFMCHYLLYMWDQKDFPVFEHALPILGRDGTLYNIQVDSPAAGHVFAKTGTYFVEDRLNNNLMVTGKGLAGYMTSASGRRYIFALYANRVSIPMGDLDAAEKIVGGTLGEIASAIYTTGP
jgi:D-alanyl-D-alanine carboxypeptidase/D-alanyl-D-alanine-endopeptidase (penicillin-binding protein 4)